MDKPTTKTKKPAAAPRTVLVVDATHQLVGRLATQVARAALHGKEVKVINCEKAAMSGRKSNILEEYKQTYHRGSPALGPFMHRQPDRLVRRIIRGMLPNKVARGRDALRRTMCYIGTPVELRDMPAVRFPEADVSKLPTTRWMLMGDVSKELGGKWNE